MRVGDVPIELADTPNGGQPANTAINIRNSPYNAVGDGVTDDTAAIQAAITAANGGTLAGQGNVVYVPPGTYLISQWITVPAGVTLRGAGGRLSTIFLATAGWNVGTYPWMVRIGNATNVFGGRVESIGCDANNISGLSTFYSDQMQEQSGFFNFFARNVCKYGLFIENGGQGGHNAKNWGIEDGTIILSATPDANAKGVYVRANGAPFRKIDTITVTITGAPSPLVGNQATSTAIQVEGAKGGLISNIHNESCPVGVLLQNNTLGSVDGTTIYDNNNLVLMNIAGHKDNITDQIKITPVSAATLKFAYEIFGIDLPGGGSSTNSITDQITNTTGTDARVGYYLLANPLGDTARCSLITTLSGASSRIRNLRARTYMTGRWYAALGAKSTVQINAAAVNKLHAMRVPQWMWGNTITALGINMTISAVLGGGVHATACTIRMALVPGNGAGQPSAAITAGSEVTIDATQAAGSVQAAIAGGIIVPDDCWLVFCVQPTGGDGTLTTYPTFDTYSGQDDAMGAGTNPSTAIVNGYTEAAQTTTVALAGAALPTATTTTGQMPRLQAKVT